MGIVFVFVFVLHICVDGVSWWAPFLCLCLCFIFVVRICVDGVSVGGQCAWCGQPVTCVIIHPFKHLEGHGWAGFC